MQLGHQAAAAVRPLGGGEAGQALEDLGERCVRCGRADTRAAARRRALGRLGRWEALGHGADVPHVASASDQVPYQHVEALVA